MLGKEQLVEVNQKEVKLGLYFICKPWFRLRKLNLQKLFDLWEEHQVNYSDLSPKMRVQKMLTKLVELRKSRFPNDSGILEGLH